MMDITVRRLCRTVISKNDSSSSSQPYFILIVLTDQTRVTDAEEPSVHVGDSFAAQDGGTYRYMEHLRIHKRSDVRGECFHRIRLHDAVLFFYEPIETDKSIVVLLEIWDEICNNVVLYIGDGMFVCHDYALHEIHIYRVL